MRLKLSAGAMGALLLAPLPALAAPTFTEIAREFTDGFVWMNANVRPALADDGTVVFAGSDAYDVYEGQVLFSGDGGPLSARDASSYGLSNLKSLRVNDLGQIVFVADRSSGGSTYRGAYATSTMGSAFSTLYQGLYPGAWPSDYVSSNIALSPNGTVAFASIVNGSGAIYRGPVAGPISALRMGSGVFYNLRDLDVNDAGSVAVQMEYTDPTAGLSRGILLFDTPGQTLWDIDTAIERLSVGSQPLPSINQSGQVAFVLSFNATLLFFDPPGVASPKPAVTMNLTPGIYISTPTPWGEPSELVQIVGTAGPYASFGRVELNDSGQVAFEATLDAGGGGIFTGPDPVAHKVVSPGDIVGPALFSWLKMGELNNAGELSLLTSDWYSTDRQVWRVGNLPRPRRIKPIIWPWPRLPLAPVGKLRLK